MTNRNPLLMRGNYTQEEFDTLKRRAEIKSKMLEFLTALADAELYPKGYDKEEVLSVIEGMKK